VCSVQASRRDPLALRHPGQVYLATALAVLGIDQLVKFGVRIVFHEGESVPVIPGVFNLTYVHNIGAAFGLFPGRQPVFIATSLAVLFVIAAYWRRARPVEWPVVVALGLVSAGALGNLIDRAFLGQVTDFFDFTLLDFPVFNVADSAIVIGVGVLAMWILFGPQDEDESSAAEQDDTPEQSGEQRDTGEVTPPVESTDTVRAKTEQPMSEDA